MKTKSKYFVIGGVAVALVGALLVFLIVRDNYRMAYITTGTATDNGDGSGTMEVSKSQITVTQAKKMLKSGNWYIEAHYAGSFKNHYYNDFTNQRIEW